MHFGERDEIIQLTPLWQGERFDDGRPRVPDSVLTRMEKVVTEEAWGVLRRHGYNFQFEGNWTTVFPERVLVGRAVTGVFIPQRPDLHDHLMEVGLNVPCRIGNATCLPGDVVLGTVTGVLFIPPHLAEEAVEHSERIRLRELFSHGRLREEVYTASQMDTQWTPEIDADFAEWRKTHTPEDLQHLRWE